MSPSAAARTVLFSVATFIALLLAALAIAGAAEAAPVPLKAKAVEVGASRVCAIKQDGGVICWGNNNGGALGHGGAEAYSNTPVTVSGLPGVSSLAAGATDQVCAVATTGSAYCWGQNHLGQVGDGTETDRRSPVKVAGISGVSQIGAGFHFTCAVATAGTVHCWGSGQNGQHGDGLKQRRSVPGPVSGISGAVQVEGGDLHACARLGGGTVYCWGDNVYGQLGDGTDDNRFTPVAVSGLTGTKAIALGSKRTCAVKSDGTVACWGLNGSYGVLGDGTTTNRLLPTQVVGLSGAKDVAIGSSFACALLESGGVSCWGRNNSGQLGDGTRTDRKTAAPVKGLSDAVALSLESSTACALRANTEVVCWGTNVASIKDETVPSRFLVPTTVAFEGVGDGGADGGPGGPGGGNAGGGKKAPARFAAGKVSIGNKVTTVTVKVPSAGRIVATQAGVRKRKPALVKKATRVVRKAGAVKIKIKPNAAGAKAIRTRGSLTVRVKFTFKPKQGKAKSFIRRITVKGKALAKTRPRGPAGKRDPRRRR